MKSNAVKTWRLRSARRSVIEQFLPKQMSEDEIKEVVKKIIADTGASSMADMGKVMGAANKQLAGKADGKTIAAVVKESLSAS